jgi:type IX secretion system PorP/SprF family membrane protein
MKRITTFLITFLCVTTTLKAQQLPLFTQYREYHSIVNPANINSDYFVDEYRSSFGVSARLQWLNIERSPRTQILRGSYISKNEGYFKLATGGHLMNDQTGPTGMTGVYGRLAIIGNNRPQQGGWSAGFNIGVTQFRLNSATVRFNEPSIANVETLRKIYPDIGVGIFGYIPMTEKEGSDILYGGLSVPQVFGLDLTVANEKGSYNFQRVPHYFATAGYYMFIGEQSFIEASTWVKYVKGSEVNVDVNLRGQISEFIWLGVGYSTARFVHTEVGFLFGDNPRFKLGYGYDHSFSTIAPFFGAVHELNLSILLGGKDKGFR